MRGGGTLERRGGFNSYCIVFNNIKTLRRERVGDGGERRGDAPFPEEEGGWRSGVATNLASYMQILSPAQQCNAM